MDKPQDPEAAETAQITEAPAVDLPRLVSLAAMRPASTKEECFYCQQPIGSPHKEDCVLIKKRVKVRMIVEYEVEVPNHWDQHMIEFHRNDGSWCADNALDELAEVAEKEGCLCHLARYEYISDTSEGFLHEG